jgi:hypothetical protein
MTFLQLRKEKWFLLSNLFAYLGLISKGTAALDLRSEL